MKAQTLAISIPNFGCKKNCPYCVSKMTGYMNHNINLFIRNMKKVNKYVELANVSNIIFTSKGEIFDDSMSTSLFLDIACGLEKYALEVQTNAESFFRLSESALYQKLDHLYNCGINVIAVSIDSPRFLGAYETLISKNENIIWRAVVNITPMIVDSVSPLNLLTILRNAGFRQVSFREITIPSYGTVNTEESINAKAWIVEHINLNEKVQKFTADVLKTIQAFGRLIRRLPYGVELYDVEGLALTYFPYCIQDTSSEDDVRSLIYQEDGHLYTTWNSKASIIF